KVFRREALEQILPESRGFFVNTEMFTRAGQLGLNVAEAGVRHRPRLRGRSKVSLLDIPRTLRTLLPFWWTRALSAGADADGPGRCPVKLASGGRQAAVPVLFLLIIASLLFFTRLSAPLLEPEEARYAEIPRQMLAEGAFAEPVLNGQPYYQKPPLLYWL